MERHLIALAAEFTGVNQLRTGRIAVFIEVGNPVELVDSRWANLIPKAEVEREALVNFPVVLRVEVTVRRAKIQNGWAGELFLGRSTQQKIREALIVGWRRRGRLCGRA